MLFNSSSYLFFLPIVFGTYWMLNRFALKWQNLFLLVVSYYFYSCWDWRFLFLLMFSTGLDYVTGLQMFHSKNKSSKIFWFWLSIGINLGFLGIFKYYNFFAESCQQFLSALGFQVDLWSLQVILPVGISFYTFHGLSYVIDIYHNKIEPERNIVDYSLFVSYFPLLVAGPIERATHLLPQLKQKRYFSNEKATEGLYQIIWGLFKKIVIADSCALYANEIFNQYESMNSFSLLLGAIYFSFQIYGDFSGYSDIALGTSKLFGIELLRNFNYPYFSRDIAEFWRRWHISLSTWFRDYLYIPLGGSKGGTWSKISNTFAIFLVSGFWHGANWTFIFWGFLNAVFFLPLLVLQKNRTHLEIVAKGNYFPSFKELVAMLLTFSLASFAWIFFRADSLNHAFGYVKKMFSFNFEGALQYLSFDRYAPELLLLLFVFLIFEWFSREHIHPVFGKMKYVTLVLILWMLLVFGVYSDAKEFIYFQF